MNDQIAIATSRRVPGSAQKARLVANLVRGELVLDAISRLRYLPHAAAVSITTVSYTHLTLPTTPYV